MSLPKKSLPFIAWFIKKQPVAFSLVLFSGIVWAVNEMSFPYFLKWIVNSITSFHDAPTKIYAALASPLIFMAIVWLFMALAMRVQGVAMIYLYPRFRANIREAVFDYVKKHSHRYFSENFAGSISKKLSELPTSCQTITELLFFNFIPVILSFVIAFFLMAKAKPIFSLIMLAWFLIHFVLTALFLRLNNQHWNDHSESVSTLTGKIVDVVTNMMTVRLFSRNGYEKNYLKKYQHDEIKKAKKAMVSVEWMRALQDISAAAFMAAMMGTLVHGWIKGWVTVGDFSMVGMLSFWILGMVWYMSYQLMVFVREVASVTEALNLISTGHDITDKTNAASLQVPHGKIEFCSVTFGYRADRPIFDNLNLVIHQGQKIGLVGFSGSGKTTFVNLLLRFFDVQNGQILIDNQDISVVLQDSLREQIAMIPQDPTLFHRSLRDNIAYGSLHATDEDIYRASKKAHCDDFIAELPEGYATLVGERGVKLSGGQRQRIAIARAIIKDAPILILDEATSSLDTVTERLIQRSINELMANRTTIVVAHRLSTLADMDRILVFDNGQIIEDGTAEQLLQNNGHFAHLCRMQRDGFLPENYELELEV